jgi:hypothetical protein
MACNTDLFLVFDKEPFIIRPMRVMTLETLLLLCRPVFPVSREDAFRFMTGKAQVPLFGDQQALVFRKMGIVTACTIPLFNGKMINFLHFGPLCMTTFAQSADFFLYQELVV